MSAFVLVLCAASAECQLTGADLAFAAGLSFNAWGDCTVYARLLAARRSGVSPDDMPMSRDGRYRVRGTNQWYECRRAVVGKETVN